MTYYHNGEFLAVPFGKRMADVLEERGVTREQHDRILGKACRFKCCNRFERVFGEKRDRDIDFGTGELLGMTVQAIIEYDWVTFYYCPFCGESFRVKLEASE